MAPTKRRSAASANSAASGLKVSQPAAPKDRKRGLLAQTAIAVLLAFIAAFVVTFCIPDAAVAAVAPRRQDIPGNSEEKPVQRPAHNSCPDGGAAAEDGSCAGSDGTSEYQVLWSEGSEFGKVQVIRTSPFRHSVDFLLAGASVVGAAYVSDDFRDQFVFKIFNILQAARFFEQTPRRALSLGLGAGAVPTAFRWSRIPTDVVELNPSILEAAVRHFGYDAGLRKTHNSGHRRRSWRHVAADGSVTEVADAWQTVMESEPEEGIAYDVVVHDVFAGANTVRLMSRALFDRLRSRWLSDRGVLLVNFLGFKSPGQPGSDDEQDMAANKAYPFSAAIARTLRSVFADVRCFTDHPPDCPRPKKGVGAPGCMKGEASNVVCFCSSKPWKIVLPKDDVMYDDPPENSAFWTVKLFQEWEVLRPDELPEVAGPAGRITGADEEETERWRGANDVVAGRMLGLAKQHLLPYEALWRTIESHQGQAEAQLPSDLGVWEGR